MSELSVNIQEVKSRAEKYYRDGDFFCSEAVVKTIKDVFNAPFDDEIIKLASGFPVGMGVGCACGAVNGAVMSIGMFFGRSEAKNKDVNKAMKLTKELQKKFQSVRKVACCKILTKGMWHGTSKHMEHCIGITGEVTAMATEIIARELGYSVKK